MFLFNVAVQLTSYTPVQCTVRFTPPKYHSGTPFRQI
uniref:Uncharacterized protein n=1 Tax=Anguilla anguilla TaxID=7936 RepID=A0A0E9U0Z1_ANGAN